MAAAAASGSVRLSRRQVQVVVAAFIIALIAGLSWRQEPLGTTARRVQLGAAAVIGCQQQQQGAGDQDQQHEQQQQQLEQEQQHQEPAPGLSAKEAQVLLEKCSPQNYADAAAKATAGAHPPVMNWGCELEQCGGGFVQSTLDFLRATPRFESLLRMLPCDLYRAIQGRTVLIVGDSQGQRFYRQMRCFLGGFIEQTEKPRRDTKMIADPEGAQRVQKELLDGFDGCCGVEAPFCTYLIGGTRVCHARVNKGAHLLHYLRNTHVLGTRKDDIWNINIGLWHHKRENEYEGLVKAVAEYYAANKDKLPVVMWRDNSPQHFNIANGEFPHPDEATAKGIWPFKGCKPIQGIKLLPNGTIGGTNKHVQAGGWRNIMSTPHIVAAGMPMQHTWNDTIEFFEGHLPNDCTHFCSPGAYNVWVWSFWRTLLRLQGGTDQGQAQQQQAAQQQAPQARR